MEKVTRSKAVAEQETFESRAQRFLSLAIISDKRMADNSIEILSGIQTYYRDIYFSLATCGCKETRLTIDPYDPSKQIDCLKQLEQKLKELRHSLGSLREWRRILNIGQNSYEYPLILFKFHVWSSVYRSFLKYEKETCKIVLDIWNLVQVLDIPNLVDHDEYSDCMSNLYEKIKDGINLQDDFPVDDVFDELKSLAENGSDEAANACEGIIMANHVPATPRALIERVDNALNKAFCSR